MFRHIHHRILFSYFTVILIYSLIIFLVISLFIRRTYFTFLIKDLKDDAKLFIDYPTKEALLKRDREFLNKIVAKAEENCTVEILDSKGTVLANSENRGIGYVRDLNVEEFNGLPLKEYGYSIRRGNENFDIIYVAVPIIDRDSVIGFVRVTTPLIYFENTIKKLKRYIISIFVITIIILFFISALFARNISFPLLEMARATKDISSGIFDREISVRSRDEVGVLADSFNNMTRRLKRFETERKRLVNNISHELMTPLTTIRGFVETLVEGNVKDKEKVKECLDIIKKESLYLEGLVEELYLFSKLDASSMKYNFRPLVVTDVILDAEDSVSVKAMEKHIDINNDFIEECPYIKADDKSLRQVFINLLDNAIKYSPQGQDIQVSIRRADRFLKVIVRDKGVGISERDRNKIFDRFYRIEDELHARKGIGLGLSIVKEILDAHKAEIDLISEIGKGSQFIITFNIS